MVSDARRWQVKPTILFRRLADGGMLYDEAGGQVLHMNETATHVWVACGRGATLEELAASLCAIYDVPPGRARLDAEAVIRQLREAGALL